MGRTQRTIEIDAPKVRAFMERRGMTAVQLSEEMGACRAFISNVLNISGRMSKTAYKALCAVFEVPEDTFTKQQPPEVITEMLEAAPDAEIMERLDRIEHKLDKLLEIWGSTS